MGKWNRQFLYIVHRDNLKEILEKGILSHNEVDKGQLNPKRISDSSIVNSRKDILTPDNISLWDYANVYFRAKNAMLFRMISEFGAENLVVLALSPRILELPGAFITTGNAASKSSEIYPASEIRKVLSILHPELGWDWWKKGDSSKRKTMAECLVHKLIPHNFIKSIYVVDYEVKEELEKQLGILASRFSIIPVPDLFFKSSTKLEITDQLHLVEGDMFFSNKQTLTISVNTVGVMGKGLASRAKYQFPDLYTYYQELCKNTSLEMGKPVLYKRDTSINDTFSIGLIEEEEPTWFLLFPTKKHFRDQSDLVGIEKGLIWIKENYKSLGITSLALPALGCGLGWLSWEDVGPMMVKHLKDLEIPVWIYLPRERKIEGKFLTKEFLLAE